MRRLLVFLSLIICGALIAIIVLLSGREKSDAQKDKAFKELTKDWQLDLLTHYKVIHYTEQSFRDNYGADLLYFQLELRKDQTSFRLARARDPRFKAADKMLGVDNSGLFPIGPSLGSKKEILWSIEPKLPSVSPKIDWWKAGTNSISFYGFTES